MTESSADSPASSNFAALLVEELSDPSTSLLPGVALSSIAFAPSQGASALHVYVADIIRQIGLCEASRDYVRRAPHEVLLPEYSLYSGRDARVNDLEKVILTATAPVVVHGPAGCGKTALLANWVAKVRIKINLERERNPDR